MSEPEAPDTPPVAARLPRRIESHGEVRVDEYYWLRERDSEAVHDYLRRENAYTEAQMSSTAALQETLYAEFISRLKEDDRSVPVRMDGYRYYTRTEAGREYPLFCRTAVEGDGREHVILDINKLAQHHDFYDIGTAEISPCQRYLAYTEDTRGDERFVLRIRDLDTGEDGPEAIENVSGGGVVWAEDGATLFYVTLDETRRPYRVFRHGRGAEAGEDAEVFAEPDEAFFVGVDKTKDRRYLLIELGSNVTSETRFLPADAPETPPAVFRERRHGVEYGIEHRQDEFFVLINQDAVNFRLDRVPAARFADPAAWSTYIAHDRRVKLEDFEVFRDHLAVVARESGMRRVRIHDLDSGERHDVGFDESVYTAGFGDNPEFDSRVVRLSYTSLVSPPRVYDYDMDQRRLSLLKEREIPAGYDRSAYRTERLWATAPDGEAVPISLVCRRDLPAGRPAPCLLYGYGAYGITVDPGFSANRLSLLDRGFVYAIAHVRGGGDLGEPWKHAGKLEQKPNTFSDFVACAEHLIDAGYTSPEQLAIMGGSAGGMLIGAALNERPDLFNAAVAQVPFVDVLNTMEDPSLPLTVIEYDEWGNPGDRAYYELIRSYAPYENVRAQAYPNLLVVAGLNDPRVQYWEPAKWAARLRATKTDHNLLLLKTYMESGHLGASGRYRALRELAFDMAFILKTAGIEQ